MMFCQLVLFFQIVKFCALKFSDFFVSVGPYPAPTGPSWGYPELEIQVATDCFKIFTFHGI